MFPEPLQTSAQYQEALKFFEKWLRADSPCRLENEYPLAFCDSNKDHILVSRINEDLRGGFVVLEREIEVQYGVFIKGFFVGSVVTDPDYRKQGLQTHLFHALEELAEKKEVDFIVLWSNQIEFYEKLGFALAGLQSTWSYKYPTEFSKNEIPVKIQSSDIATLTEKHFKAFDKKMCRVRRTQEEFFKLSKIPQMTVASTENAYVLLGKGEDFKGICHEWAGPSEEVLACFDALSRWRPDIKILTPGVFHLDEEKEVGKALEAHDLEPRLEYLGLFKSTNPEFNLAFVQPNQLKFPFFIWGLDSI